MFFNCACQLQIISTFVVQKTSLFLLCVPDNILTAGYNRISTPGYEGELYIYVWSGHQVGSPPQWLPVVLDPKPATTREH